MRAKILRCGENGIVCTRASENERCAPAASRGNETESTLGRGWPLFFPLPSSSLSLSLSLTARHFSVSHVFRRSPPPRAVSIPLPSSLFLSLSAYSSDLSSLPCSSFWVLPKKIQNQRMSSPPNRPETARPPSSRQNRDPIQSNPLNGAESTTNHIIISTHSLTLMLHKKSNSAHTPVSCVKKRRERRS